MIEESQVKELVKNRINHILQTRDISMRTLSLELGFSKSYISQIMNNDMMPSLQAVIAICNMSDMTLSDFFNNEETYPIEYYTTNDQLKKLTADRLQALSLLLQDMIK